MIMKSIKEIDEQIQAEHNHIFELYNQIKVYERNCEQLAAERKVAEEAERNAFIDKWLNDNFGILCQKEAIRESIFIVFDKYGSFVTTITIGYNGEFRYASPIEDRRTMEYWLRENKLYAQNAAAFCNRNKEWYKKTLKEQLEDLCWEFDKNGKLKNTLW